MNVRSSLKKCADIPVEKRTRFYKTGKGDYAEGDQFLGVRVPEIRKVAKRFSELGLEEIEQLMQSPFNEERFCALCILVERYQKGDAQEKDLVFRFYLAHLTYVNNWNLVDASAHLIVGAHLFRRDRGRLISMAKSEDLWERRVAIVATWYFIRKNDLDWTFTLAKLLMDDDHDLIQKATGWMLREAGKKDEAMLIKYLDQYAECIPRTMLRYATERLSRVWGNRY